MKKAYENPEKFGIMSSFAASMTTVVSQEVPKIAETKSLRQKNWLKWEHFTRPYIDVYQKVHHAFQPIKEHLANHRIRSLRSISATLNRQFSWLFLAEQKGH